mmetsp:Transcript_27588/g.35631  ORF Transcript_27588/g.35631 Transcript_27588/m.35631 type:complete len:174 (-) Transcript_27588:200-721(-)
MSEKILDIVCDCITILFTFAAFPLAISIIISGIWLVYENWTILVYAPIFYFAAAAASCPLLLLERRHQRIISQLHFELENAEASNEQNSSNAEGTQKTVPLGIEICKKGSDIFPSGKGYCCICQDNLEQADILACLVSCHHYYHISCISLWAKYQAKCPLCKQEFFLSKLKIK